MEPIPEVPEPPPLPLLAPALAEPAVSETARAKPKAPGGTSRHKGVSWYSQRGMWRAEIKISGKKHRLGYFHNEDDAARKYDELAAPQGRPLNFPFPGSHNVVKGGRGGSSGFKGVSWQKKKKKWVSQIMLNGKVTYLGYFDAEEDAARKFDEVAAPLGRIINFPSEYVGAAVAGSAGPGANGCLVRKAPPASSLGEPQLKITRTDKLSMPSNTPATAQTAVIPIPVAAYLEVGGASASTNASASASASADSSFSLPKTPEFAHAMSTAI